MVKCVVWDLDDTVWPGVAIESDMPYVVDSTELMAKCPSKYDGARINLQPPTPQYK